MAKKPRNSRGPSPQPQAHTQPGPQENSEPASLVPPATRPTITSLIWDIQKAMQLVTLAALYSHSSQLALAPVYGSAPAGMYHRYGMVTSVFLGMAIRKWARRFVPPNLSKFVPTFVFWIPTIQFTLCRFSSTLGNPAGPLITEILTYYPLVAASIYLGIESLEKLDLSSFDPLVADIGPTFSPYVFFTLLERSTKGLFMTFTDSNFFLSRIGKQLALATLYAFCLPSAYIWPSIPTAAFTMLGNVHNPLLRTSEVLNNTLALYDYRLLERRESNTGYISVLESRKDQFRVLRCDHSLLGGEWTIPPPPGRTLRAKEPIFHVFTMLEAVRLVEGIAPEKIIPDSERNLLNIGLGVGTAPAAMIAHGIDTTIIEVDPYVYHFARKYFDLPSNHTFAIGDAGWIVNSWSRNDTRPLYDYIIHDVFTGGIVPSDLFTVEFLSDLATLLKPDGVIAINYAGDLAMPATSLVYRTISRVFPSCHAFRESKEDLSKSGSKDVTNMVFFCKSNPSSPIKFRKPVPSDFLGSGIREEFLLPKFEIPADKFVREGQVLNRGKTREIDRCQVQSAVEHWNLMRNVLPAAIWENW